MGGRPAPVGAIFFVTAVALVTASAVRLAGGLEAAGVCSVRARPPTRRLVDWLPVGESDGD